MPKPRATTVLVHLRRDFRNLNAGEVAGFTPEEAGVLAERGTGEELGVQPDVRPPSLPILLDNGRLPSITPCAAVFIAEDEANEATCLWYDGFIGKRRERSEEPDYWWHSGWRKRLTRDPQYPIEITFHKEWGGYRLGDIVALPPDLANSLIRRRLAVENTAASEPKGQTRPKKKPPRGRPTNWPDDVLKRVLAVWNEGTGWKSIANCVAEMKQELPEMIRNDRLGVESAFRRALDAARHRRANGKL